MALPSNVTYGTIVGRFLIATADSPDDSDRDPEGTPALDLKVTFSAELSPAVVRDATATPPTFFGLADVKATIGPDGTLLGPDGQPGVRLVASTNPALNPSGWTWGVNLFGTGYPKLGFSFLLDGGQTIDLGTVLQVPSNPGGALNAWLQAVADAQAARDAAIAAAASVPSAASLATTFLTYDGTNILKNGTVVPVVGGGAALDDSTTSASKVWSSSKVSSALSGKATPADISTAISGLVGAAPAALDTVYELAAQFASDENAAAALTTLVGTKIGLPQAAKNPDLLIVGSITRDVNGVITTAAVVWPDGKPGTFTTNSIDASGAINGYSITYGSPVTKTYTQPTITRDASGAATLVPQITAA